MKNHLLITGALATAALSVLAPSDSLAQSRNKNFLPYSTVGLGIGTASYYGELSGYRRPLRSTFMMMRWNANLAYTRHFTPRLAARASFTYARIAGDDYTYNKGDLNRGIVQYVRNLHFRNDLKEFALTGIYQFRPDGRNTNYRVKFSPYIFAGLALVAHSPEAKTPVGYTPPGGQGDQPQNWVKLQPLGTEGQGQPGAPKQYSLVTIAVPVGFGVRYKLNDRFDLGAEVGLRLTTTDYLDDVGGPTPPDPSVLKDDLSRAMSDRSLEPVAARKGGDRRQQLTDYLNGQDPFASNGAALPGIDARGSSDFPKDGYLIGTIQLRYVLLPKIKCPPVK
ncbi:outer membrane beta-barrel protein [Tellurirhabdus rosea]|uniref:outer membrane beta-barrel protein n=1 Tax=Tellurirhabdus rosea TaxID=2674997 RepID=UPI002254D656|nr:outer membrane beta-barrel protein [Tellurirhabdus rosea]